MSSPEYLQLDQQICLSLYSAANALIRAYHPILKPLDLTYPQYLVMLALWETAELSVTEICTKTRLETGTVTPLLKRLEAKGLIYRGRSDKDERKRVISLTSAGETLQKQAENVPFEVACLNILSPEQGEQIKLLAETLYQNLTASPNRE